MLLIIRWIKKEERKKEQNIQFIDLLTQVKMSHLKKQFLFHGVLVDVGISEVATFVSTNREILVHF